MVSVEKQMDILCRGIVDLHVRAELEERIGSGRPLRVKAGFDPTRIGVYRNRCLSATER